ncbi:MAG TPA: hypothetical protein VIL26_03980 [Clostridia bacterium]
MEEYLNLISVPGIAAVVYSVMEIIKHAVKGNEIFKQIIPLLSVALGAGIGLIAFYAMPSIVPADNILMAIIIGGASGLTATGTNQIFKQLSKGKE